MKSWTIQRRIILGYAGLLALVAVLTATAYYSFQRTKREAIFLSTDSIPGFTAAAKLDSMAADIQNRLLHVMLSKSPQEQRKLQDEIAAMRTDILKVYDDYDQSISLAVDREMFNHLIEIRDKYVEVRTELFTLVNAGKTDEATTFLRASVEPTYAAYKKLLDDLLAFNTLNASKAGTAAVAVTGRAQFITVGLSLAVIVVGIIATLVIVRGLNRLLIRLSASLGDSASQVAGAAGQVSASSQSLAEGSSEQAASLEETSSSLEEMSSMTQRNAENAGKAYELAKSARAAADRGTTDMQAMAAAMDAIKHASDDIAKILKTIDEIAFQTNLLALNAAVEAARAGEAGAGFAVVADEVRSLAQRAAAAAKETAEKIEGAIGKSAQGVEISGKVAAALNEIVTKVRQVDELVSEVASASREQSQGIVQINTAVSQMDKVTQTTAANAEESAAAAEELNAQAVAMHEAVRELQHLVGGAKDSGDGAPSPNGHPGRTAPPATAARGRKGGNGHSAPPKTVVTAPARQTRPAVIPMESGFRGG